MPRRRTKYCLRLLQVLSKTITHPTTHITGLRHQKDQTSQAYRNRTSNNDVTLSSVTSQRFSLSCFSTKAIIALEYCIVDEGQGDSLLHTCSREFENTHFVTNFYNLIEQSCHQLLHFKQRGVLRLTLDIGCTDERPRSRPNRLSLYPILATYVVLRRLSTGDSIMDRNSCLVSALFKNSKDTTGLSNALWKAPDIL